MNKRKTIVGVGFGLIIVVGIVIAHIWFGLFSSPEYYKGFDWNTNEKMLEWRLGKDFSWEMEDEYKEFSKVCHLEGDQVLWYQESYQIDKKTGKLREVRLYYETKSSDSMRQLYDTEVERIEKKTWARDHGGIL